MTRIIAVAFLTLVLGAPGAGVSAQEAKLFATVNGEEIAEEVYERAIVSGARNRFYHRTPPEGEMLAFRREVGQRLIEERLLLEEADRRGIKADRKTVKRQLEQFEEKYADNPQWQEERKTLVPEIRQSLEDQSRLRALLAEVEQIPPPSDKELRAYYDANRDLFTAPEQVRVSTILLKVEPWATAEAWRAAEAEARKLVKRLRGGASFEELARLHSQDPSAEKGGDLGYIHEGMLGEVAQAALDKLKPGQVSDPVQLLEGVSILRLDERLPPRLSPFEEVRERVTGLWERERRTEENESLRRRLVAAADIEIHDADFRRWWESPDRTRAVSSPGGR